MVDESFSGLRFFTDTLGEAEVLMKALVPGIGEERHDEFLDPNDMQVKLAPGYGASWNIGSRCIARTESMSELVYRRSALGPMDACETRRFRTTFTNKLGKG